MAVVEGPLFSLSASGSIAKTLTYAERSRGSYVKGNRLRLIADNIFEIKSVRSETQEQEGIRSTFCKASKGYIYLPKEEKDEFNRRAIPYGISGMNLYIKEYILKNYSSVAEKYHWVFSVGACNPLFIFTKCSMRLAGLVSFTKK